MPDWSYQTLFRPVLFRMKARTARDFTLGAMGALSRLPFGSFVIKTLGHMESSAALETSKLGFPIRYPVGLSGPVDPQLKARKAMAQFGFGFMEVGPVTVREVRSAAPVRLEPDGETIVYPEARENEGLERVLRRLEQAPRHPLPQLLRVAPMPGASLAEAEQELLLLLSRLAPCAAAFAVDCGEREPGEAEALVRRLGFAAKAAAAARPLLLVMPPDLAAAPGVEPLCAAALESGWSGFVVGDAVAATDGCAVGRAAKPHGLALLRRIRAAAGPGPTVWASCGVHEPQDALELYRAGADAVLLHSGLVYAGPGLPKRINDALIYERTQPEYAAAPGFWSGWGWMTLLGIGMIVGGLLAWIVAATSVMLPYDIAYLGTDQAALIRANPRLLQFMSHDRITLAGTMISIGVQYYMLGKYGLRRELHWAKTALLTSGIVGFSSFFLYLGYGYFDPLHALAAALLLPAFILAMRGQFAFVALGFALASGGIVISLVGVTNVFVPQDLAYLCTTPDALRELNARLLPLIAHDRAGFGGALLSDAIALLAASLWGIQRGERWLWRMLLLAGLPGFAAGFSVHAHIGYTDFIHLLPAYTALLLYAAGLIGLYPYLHSDKK